MTILESLCGPRRHAAPRIAATDAAATARRDPTGTLPLRNRFKRDLDQRFGKLKRLAAEAIATGIVGPATPASIAHSAMQAQRSLPGGDEVKHFAAWIDEAMRQVVLGGDGGWTAPFIAAAAVMAQARAGKLIGRDVVVDDKRTKHLASLTVTELQGVCEAVSQQTTRVLAHALLTHWKPGKIARTVCERIDKVGRTRSRMVAEYMVVKAFSAATLDAFRSAGIGKVGTLAERVKVKQTAHGKVLAKDRERSPDLELTEVITAGDNDVCPICEDISDDGPYDIDEAEDLIPAHSGCRCAFVPSGDARFAAHEPSDTV